MVAPTDAVIAVAAIRLINVVVRQAGQFITTRMVLRDTRPVERTDLLAALYGNPGAPAGVQPRSTTPAPEQVPHRHREGRLYPAAVTPTCGHECRRTAGPQCKHR